MKRALNLLQTILTCVLGLILAVNVWMMFQRLVMDVPLPSIFGYTHATVVSGSMSPTLNVGDMVIYQVQDQYAVDDIIIFQQGDYFVTHRIVGEDDGWFITKGDYNNTTDADPLNPADIHGKMVVVIPNVGDAIEFLKTPAGILVLVVIGILLIESPNITRKGKREAHHGKRTKQ